MKLITLLGAVLLSSCPLVSDAQIAQPGDTVPSINGRLLSGGKEPFKIESYRGKVVMLEFWATWCGPCVGAFPHVNELSEQYKRKGVEFFSISVDEGVDSVSKVKRLLSVRPLLSQVVLSDMKALQPFNITAIPATVLVRKDGTIDSIVGPNQVTPAVLDALLAERPSGLAAKNPPPPTPQSPSESKSLFALSITKSTQSWKKQSSNSSGFELLGLTVPEVAAFFNGVSPRFVISDEGVSKDKWDVSVRCDGALRKTVMPVVSAATMQTIGYATRKEKRSVDVTVIRCPSGPKVGVHGELCPSKDAGGGHSSGDQGILAGTRSDIKGLMMSLEWKLGETIIDETGIKTPHDWRLTYKEGDNKSLIDALREAGLTITHEKRDVEVLLVSAAAKS